MIYDSLQGWMFNKNGDNFYTVVRLPLVQKKEAIRIFEHE